MIIDFFSIIPHKHDTHTHKFPIHCLRGRGLLLFCHDVCLVKALMCRVVRFDLVTSRVSLYQAVHSSGNHPLQSLDVHSRTHTVCINSRAFAHISSWYKYLGKFKILHKVYDQGQINNSMNDVLEMRKCRTWESNYKKKQETNYAEEA